MQWERPYDEWLGILHTQSSLSILFNATVTKQVRFLQYSEELTRKNKTKNGSQQTKVADQQNGTECPHTERGFNMQMIWQSRYCALLSYIQKKISFKPIAIAVILVYRIFNDFTCYLEKAKEDWRPFCLNVLISVPLLRLTALPLSKLNWVIIWIFYYTDLKCCNQLILECGLCLVTIKNCQATIWKDA